MDTNDFLGSFAHENVSFTTRIVKTASVGDNFWTLMIFVESDRFVNATTEDWEAAPGLPSCKVLVVDADTYSEYTSGLLAAWLYDLFCNGFSGNCILVAPCASTVAPVLSYEKVVPLGTENPSTEGWYEYSEASQTYSLSADTTVNTSKTYYKQVSTPGFIPAMEEAFDVLRAYAYHKTVCAGGADATSPEFAVALAKKCASSESYLSGVPLLPCVNYDPELDPLAKALREAGADAFLSWHSDSTRNASLYSLGLALAVTNGSKTPVGNTMDRPSSTNITASNGGVNPTTAQKKKLKNAHIQYFKTVGDNSNSVCAEGDKTLQKFTYAAYWVIAYITYMTKVGIARLITQRNFNKNSYNYTQIVGVMAQYLESFVSAGVIEDLAYNIPSFANLPSADDSGTITIDDAWSASYVNHLGKVKITGSLYISADN